MKAIKDFPEFSKASLLAGVGAGVFVWLIYSYLFFTGSSPLDLTLFTVAPISTLVAGALASGYIFKQQGVWKTEGRQEVRDTEDVDQKVDVGGEDESVYGDNEETEVKTEDDSVDQGEETIDQGDGVPSDLDERGGIGFVGALNGAYTVAGFFAVTFLAVMMYGVGYGSLPVWVLGVVGVVYPVFFGGVGGLVFSTRVRIGKVVSSVMVTLGAFVFGVVLFVLVSQVMRGIPATSELVSTPAVIFAMSTILFQGVAFGTVAYFYLQVRDLDLSFLGFRKPSLRDIGWVVAGLVTLLFGANVIGYVFNQAGVEAAQNTIQSQGMENPEIFLIMIPLAFLLIGPGEEMLFRGVIQNSLDETFSSVSAVVIASVVFAVAHYLALTGGGSRFATLAVIFVLSLILGASYELSDNLWVSALIHGGYDAILFAAMYFIATGGIQAAV